MGFISARMSKIPWEGGEVIEEDGKRGDGSKEEGGRRRKKNEIRLTDFNLTWHHIQLVHTT